MGRRPAHWENGHEEGVDGALRLGAFPEEEAGAQVHPTAAFAESPCGLTQGVSISDLHSVTLGVPSSSDILCYRIVRYPGQWQSIKWKTRLGGHGFTGKYSHFQSWSKGFLLAFPETG